MGISSRISILSHHFSCSSHFIFTLLIFVKYFSELMLFILPSISGFRMNDVSNIDFRKCSDIINYHELEVIQLDICHIMVNIVGTKFFRLKGNILCIECALIVQSTLHVDAVTYFLIKLLQ